MDARFRCEIPLPPAFRPADMLAFHRRDAQEVAERVTDSALQKGLVWADAPACLGLTFRAGAAEADLRQAGFSQTKARTVLYLAQQVSDRRLPLADWLATRPVETIREALLAVRGVGPWTVDYALLRGFGWLDGSLHGDAAVRRQLQVLLGSPDKVGERQAAEWLAEFSPWRALVAAHLWAMH